MSLLFKNYPLAEAIYLLIRFNKTKFFLRNIKNGMKAKHKHHTEREKYI